MVVRKDPQVPPTIASGSTGEMRGEEEERRKQNRMII